MSAEFGHHEAILRKGVDRMRHRAWLGLAMILVGVAGLAFATAWQLPFMPGGTEWRTGGPFTGPDGMGRMMGAFLSGAQVPRVTRSQAIALGNAVPTGATADRATNQLVFRTNEVQLTLLASPPWGKDMTFRVAGLTDPTIIVPQGAQVRVDLINADNDTSHGWLLTPVAPPFRYMAMMGTPPAFSGSFAPPLGESSGAGMPSETIVFQSSASGRYTYLCPVPGHAQRGMYGVFVVTHS